MPVLEAVAEVARWYAARSLPARAHVHPDRPEADAFAQAGWSVYDPTLLLLASVAKVVRKLGPRQVAEPRHDSVLDEAWLATDERAAKYGESARAVMESGEVTFATVRDVRDVVLARGRGAFHGDWVGVSALWTDPAHRSAGLSSAVLQSLVSWGAERGATTAYLQVVEANEHARHIYEARGFEVHHRYAYLVDDGGSAGAQP
jgi:GNAT superfamily N-acetyltransferase